MKGGREFSEDEVSFASGDIVHHYRNIQLVTLKSLSYLIFGVFFFKQHVQLI